MIFPFGKMAAIGDSKQFGDAVRRARKARGLRQEDLALAAGVGLRFVGDLERGKPTSHLLDLAIRVADAAGLAVVLDDQSHA